MIMKTAMGIATKNLATWGDGSFFGALYAPTVIKPGYEAAEKGDRPEATHASAPDARSGQCLDSTEAV
jgi:hypothetical protein